MDFYGKLLNSPANTRKQWATDAKRVHRAFWVAIAYICTVTLWAIDHYQAHRQEWELMAAIQTVKAKRAAVRQAVKVAEFASYNGIDKKVSSVAAKARRATVTGVMDRVFCLR